MDKKERLQGRWTKTERLRGRWAAFEVWCECRSHRSVRPTALWVGFVLHPAAIYFPFCPRMFTEEEKHAWEEWLRTGQWTNLACRAAAFLGRLDLVIAAAKTAKTENIMISQYDVFVAAARGGHKHILTWMRKQHGCHPTPALVNACAMAAYGNQDDTLKWLHAQGYPWNELTCANIAFRGNLPLLQWARARGCPWDENTCASAAEGGHLRVLQWCRAQDPPCPWNESTCNSAARGGLLGVLQWCRAQDPPCPWNESTCRNAVEGGQLDVLQWCRAQRPPCPWDESTCESAAGRGQLGILKWCRAQHPPCPWNHASCMRIMAQEHGIKDWILTQR